MRIQKYMAALAVAVTAGSASAATMVNGSFESGLAGWATVGSVAVESTDVAPGWGGFAAQLSAGRGAGLYTRITQSITLDAYESVVGAVKWIGNDRLPSNDDGFVKLVNQDSLAVTTVFSASIASFGDYVSSPWVYFTFVAPVAGIYDLTAGVRNVGSNNANSLLRVDFATQPVPEPEGLSLTLAGLGALAFVARRRRTL